MSVPLDSPTVEVGVDPWSPDARAAAIFDLDGSKAVHPKRTARRRMLGVAVGAVIVVIALVASRALSAGTQGYQVATVTTRDVVSTWDGVATIEPTSQASVAFPVSGTVETVDVREGDTVVVGQTLATLDEAALVEALHQKQSTLAQAKLTLARALDGEDVGGSGSPSGSNAVVPTAATTSGGQDTSAPSGGGNATSPQVAQAQQAVLQAQQQVDAALAKSSEALAAASSVCAASSAPPSEDEGSVVADVTACETALQQVLVQQQATAQAQRELADASRALDQLLAQQATAGSTSSSTPANGRAESSSSAASPSAADLAKYQAAVDAAAADVVAAQQAIGQATMVSPIAGTVTSVDIAVGDDVSSGSTTDHIEIVGAGGYEATTTVGIDDIADVKVGQSASVAPDGVGRRIRGEVVAISISPVDGSTTTYLVTVALQGKTDDLRIGSTGSVSIVTERADGATAVPTSAVAVGANRSTVQVLAGSEVTTVPVEVGVIGDTWTQIVSGVTSGQTVVVADRDKPLPTSATDSSNGTQVRGGFGGLGGFPGGGRFPGR